MADPSFARMATKTYNTTRVGVAVVTGGKCLPLDALGDAARAMLALDTSNNVLETYVDGSPDIKNKDVFVVSGVSYGVIRVTNRDWETSNTVHILLEDLRVT